ncbi:sugar transporter domain-containing protein [Phthorimaea operculella]|nr:sugar transporter domain-containing protein [Phthorimaea operculella]
MQNEMILEEKIPKDQKGTTYRQWLVAITVNLATLTYGMQAGWLSPSLKTLLSKDSPTGAPLTDTEISLVGSTQSFAAIIGVPVFSYLADKYGRKFCIILAAVLQAIGWAIKLSSANTPIIITARFLGGLTAGGGCFVVVPMYVKEIAQDDIRGLVGSLLIMFQNIGFLLIYAIGAYLSYFTVLWVVLWIPIIQIALMIKAPESPSFLVKIGKTDEAVSAIAFLRGLDEDDEKVLKEIDCMRKEDLYFKSLPDISLISILKDKSWRNIIIRMLALVTIHASNGTFAIVTYASAILGSSSSSSSINPELQSLSFPLVMILAAFVSMSCVEKWGRKPVLTLSLVLLVGSMLCVASTILVQHQGGSVPFWIPLLAMIVCVAAYAFGLSPVPFIMIPEMLNFQIRAKSMGAIVTYTWFCTFMQVLLFTPLSNALGLYGLFYLYAVINAVGLFISVALLTETKGKTTEQIESEMRSK